MAEANLVKAALLLAGLGSPLPAAELPLPLPLLPLAGGQQPGTSSRSGSPQARGGTPSAATSRPLPPPPPPPQPADITGLMRAVADLLCANPGMSEQLFAALAEAAAARWGPAAAACGAAAPAAAAAACAATSGPGRGSCSPEPRQPSFPAAGAAAPQQSAGPASADSPPLTQPVPAASSVQGTAGAAPGAPAVPCTCCCRCGAAGTNDDVLLAVAGTQPLPKVGQQATGAALTSQHSAPPSPSWPAPAQPTRSIGKAAATAAAATGSSSPARRLSPSPRAGLVFAAAQQLDVARPAAHTAPASPAEPAAAAPRPLPAIPPPPSAGSDASCGSDSAGAGALLDPAAGPTGRSMAQAAGKRQRQEGELGVSSGSPAPGQPQAKLARVARGPAKSEGDPGGSRGWERALLNGPLARPSPEQLAWAVRVYAEHWRQKEELGGREAAPLAPSALAILGAHLLHRHLDDGLK